MNMFTYQHINKLAAFWRHQHSGDFLSRNEPGREGRFTQGSGKAFG